MNIIFVLEAVGFLLALLFFITQLALPAFNGTKLFPMFRREGKLQKRMADVKQEQREHDLADDVHKAQSKLRRKK